MSGVGAAREGEGRPGGSAGEELGDEADGLGPIAPKASRTSYSMDLYME